MSNRKTGRVAAFFDLDKTIIARSSAYAFNKQFLNQGLISASSMVQLAISQAMYISQGHDHNQMEAARDRLSSMVTGWQADHVRRIAEESLNHAIFPYVYAEARALIRTHQTLGHDVYIVSASATELVEPIAAAIGVHRTVATQLEVKDGVYTGEVTFFCKAENKVEAIRNLAAEEGYDLEYCYAYSDSITDEPMLSAVGRPMAVNPDKSLRKLATERSWPIRDFHNPEPLFGSTPKKATALGLLAGATALGLGAFALRRGRDGKDES